MTFLLISSKTAERITASARRQSLMGSCLTKFGFIQLILGVSDLGEILLSLHLSVVLISVI